MTENIMGEFKVKTTFVVFQQRYCKNNISYNTLHYDTETPRAEPNHRLM